MIDLHLFALNCNESFRIVVDEKEKRAKLCCLTLSILVFYVKCFIINLLGPPGKGSRCRLLPCRSAAGIPSVPLSSSLSGRPSEYLVCRPCIPSFLHS